METLQKEFEELFRREFSLPAFATRLAQKTLQEQGKPLSERQLRAFRNAFEKALSSDATTKDAVTITIPDASIRERLLFFKKKPVTHIGLDLSELDIDDALDNFVKSLPSIIEEASTAAADGILRELLTASQRMLRERHREMRHFHYRVRKAWSHPLDLLETMIVLATEAGGDFNHEFRPAAAAENDTTFEAITHLHARACQVAGEVHALLSAGFADGAHARWRTLHEINAVALLIASKGNDLAERYLLHSVVESHKAAKLHQTYAARLGYEPLVDEELKEISEASAQLIAKFGPEYASDYGWAADALSNPQPTFADIERAVDLQHLRPYYRLASHNVHANPKGALFRLGLYPDSEPILLAGPSTAGFADPGHGAAISLGSITTTLLTLRPNMDRIVMARVLLRFVDMLGEDFLSAQEADQAETSRLTTR